MNLKQIGGKTLKVWRRRSGRACARSGSCAAGTARAERAGKVWKVQYGEDWHGYGLTLAVIVERLSLGEQMWIIVSGRAVRSTANALAL